MKEKYPNKPQRVTLPSKSWAEKTKHKVGLPASFQAELRYATDTPAKNIRMSESVAI